MVPVMQTHKSGTSLTQGKRWRVRPASALSTLRISSPTKSLCDKAAGPHGMRPLTLVPANWIPTDVRAVPGAVDGARVQTQARTLSCKLETVALGAALKHSIAAVSRQEQVTRTIRAGSGVKKCNGIRQLSNALERCAHFNAIP